MLSTREVAKRLAVGQDHVVALIRCGKLAAVNISTSNKPRYRVSEQGLTDFLAGQAVVVRTPDADASPGRRRFQKPAARSWFRPERIANA